MPFTKLHLLRNYEHIIGNLEHKGLIYMDAGMQNDIISLDLSIAFDLVPRYLLLYKLHKFGFNSTLLNWLNKYLHNRSQSIIIEGNVSLSLPVKSGVPQGSILKPLHFL